MASLFGFRPRGLGLSALETAAYYAARNGITTPPTVHRLPATAADDKTDIERADYRHVGRPPVTLYTIPAPRRAAASWVGPPAISSRQTPSANSSACPTRPQQNAVD
ncbi:hypothetical protein [Nonomuraea lactucae]|uniref:hypothetical protein n=1 Tax=Nonomuraea lactucae TaxID=2249762 RepID=UPI000DE3EE20|nr:hypothetical protein [Nonomuraea lactucae]